MENLRMRSYLYLLLLGGVLALVGGSPAASAFGQVSEDEQDAVVKDSDYNGPPAVGKALSQPPGLGPVPAGDLHEVCLDAVNRRVRIAEGESITAWTFGGTVPGPTLHVGEGDTVDVTMANRSGQDIGFNVPGKEPHSIDFHAAQVAPNDEFRGIEAGRKIHFRWRAESPGVFLYHCMGAAGVEEEHAEEGGGLVERYEGTALDVMEHVAHGMFGVVIVEPKEGWPHRADREFVLVKNEWYVQPPDTSEGHQSFEYDAEAALRKRPRWVAFNGRAYQYVDQPLTVEAWDRVRLYLVNAGPNDAASIHVIGSIFDSVYRNGSPENPEHGLQVVLVPAATGAVGEFVVPEPGVYKILDHELTDAAKGAIGRIRAE